jgi:hypothetical protein
VTNAQKPANTTAAVRVLEGAGAGETIPSIMRRWEIEAISESKYYFIAWIKHFDSRAICPHWVI